MDVEAARKLLAEAGVATPVPGYDHCYQRPAAPRTAEVLQAQANQVCVVDIKQMPWSLITVLRQKDFDLCMSPWSGCTRRQHVQLLHQDG